MSVIGYARTSTLHQACEPRALSSLGGGKGYGRGAEGIGPSHREQGNGQQGKGFGPKAVTYWTGGESAEESKVAVARKLAVIMHGIWSDHSEYRWTAATPPAAA